MKLRLSQIFQWLVGAACGAAALSASGQGFINLDFEQAVVQPVDPSGIFLDWSLAVPGWGSGMPYIYYRQGHLGVSPLYLLMDSTSPEWAPGTQLAGNYSLYFHSGHAFNDPFSAWLHASISQPGLVPSSARSIRLLATGPFKVFLGGVEIPMVSLGGSSYGGDVSEFAGEILNLTIMNNASVGHVEQFSVVDNVEFSAEVIPEPSILAVVGLGGGALATRLAQRKRTTDAFTASPGGA